MGIPVVDDEMLRLFIICADPGEVDIDKLRHLNTVPAPRAPEEDTASAPVKKSKHKKAEQPLSESEGFMAALAKEGVVPRKHKSKKHSHAVRASADARGADDSDDEDDVPLVAQRDKQQMVSDTCRIIRENGLPYDPPTMRDSYMDVMKKHDAVVREAASAGIIETALSGIVRAAPYIEIFIIMRVPAARIQGWSTFISQHIDYMRGPLGELYRRHLMSFSGYSNPYFTLGMLLLGSMVVTAVSNTMFGDSGAWWATQAVSVAGPFLGMYPTAPPTVAPAPAASRSRPAGAPSVPPPPPPSAAPPGVAGRPRPTMAPPSFA